MHYQTMILELIEQNPILHEELRASLTLLATVERQAIALRELHRFWMGRLAETRPASHPIQLASEALELALQEIQADLLLRSSQSGSVSDAAPPNEPQTLPPDPTPSE